MLSTLLESGACPNTQPDGEDTPLMLAAGDCLPNCVKLLLQSGAHSNHIGKDGLTALHKCISATGLSSIIDFAHIFKNCLALKLCMLIDKVLSNEHL